VTPRTLTNYEPTMWMRGHLTALCRPMHDPTVPRLTWCPHLTPAAPPERMYLHPTGLLCIDCWADHLPDDTAEWECTRCAAPGASTPLTLDVTPPEVGSTEPPRVIAVVILCPTCVDKETPA
jgi:hypothetical protein